jgi:hypothetical protein
MEALILFSALIIGYVLLRLCGGEGLNIKFELGQTSSPKGKRNRLILAIVLAMWSVALVIVFAMQQENGRMAMALALVAAVVVFFLAMRKNNLKCANFKYGMMK